MGFFSSLFGGKDSSKSGSRSLKKIDVAKRFELSGKTGQGSMSKVYRAYDRESGRTVCLKLLDKLKTQKFEERFTGQGLKKPSEGDICMLIKHENVIRTYEHGITTQGEPYLIMEWVEGSGLNTMIDTKNARLNGNRLNLLMQLCDSIAYLHDAKFLHRDICPRNIMVTQDDVLKLIDFGLTIPYLPAFCAPGNRTGTPDYLAPELVKRKATDHRVDIYALGVTAFEIFTGGLPWERTQSSEENFRRRLNTPPRSPKELNPKLGDDLCAAILKAMAKDTADRFASAKHFKEALLHIKKKDY